ncbi:hypothetical protein [Sphingomonas sp. MMS24-J13]|uniref:hypothetical protein n=1 Tax=Sphingomonas sp. MMS24-J13 TaxID=3238686 RepID=UPI00384B9B94
MRPKSMASSHTRAGPLSLLATLMLAVAVASPAEAQPQAATGAARSFLGVRVLKRSGVGRLAWTVQLSPTCKGCEIVLNDFASGQNDKEFFFHILVPPAISNVGPVHVTVDPKAVRGVLFGITNTEMAKNGYVRPEPRAEGMGAISYRPVSGGIVFALPRRTGGASLPPDDLGDVTQQYTYIETPGVYIRVGHADIARRRGDYATGPWPTLQAQAALNLEFAAREAINALKIVRTLPALGVTTIMLMNFDTNYPTLEPDKAHGDWPPHWHMHVLWQDPPRVRKVGHFYLSSEGLLVRNESNDPTAADKVGGRARLYARGATDETRTPDGKLVYSHMITAEGYFEIASEHGVCLLKPIADGFESGVRLSCNNGQAIITIRAVDHPAAGRLRLYLNDRLTNDYRYDPDTGALLSAPAGRGKSDR